MKRAVIYARYSAGPQQTEQSIEGQVRVCKKHIEEKGFKFIKLYQDKHITGTTDRRPEFQQMLADAEALRFDVLVLYSSDRFSRNKYDSVVYKAKLRQLGIEIYYAAENIPEGPEGVLLESLMEGWAQYYSEELSRKVVRGMTESAKKAQTNGPKPMGYKTGPNKEWIIDEEEAEIVRLIFKRFLQGHTMAAIAREVNSLGYTTRRGKTFRSGSVRSILANEKYTGRYQWSDVIIEDGVPVIVGKEDFAAAQIKLQNKPHRPKGEFRLTGKLFCGICGEHWTGTSGTGKNGVHYYYKCRCGHHKNIRRDLLEAVVFEEAKKALSQPLEFTKLVNNIDDLREQNNALRDELGPQRRAWKKLNDEAERIMKHLADGTETSRMMKRLQEIDNELLPSLEAEMVDLKEYSPSITRQDIEDGLKAFLSSSDEVIGTLINKVLITENYIKIYFNLLEDDSVKATDLIKFEQDAKCSTNQFPGRTLKATPWGLLLEICYSF